MAIIGSVLKENVVKDIRDVHNFRVAKSLLVAVPSEEIQTVLETVLFSDDSIMQFSDDTLVEW
jgi:hypothetical protein